MAFKWNYRCLCVFWHGPAWDWDSLFMGYDIPNRIKLIYPTWNNRYFWIIFWMDLSGMDFLVLVSTGPEHPQTNHHPTGVLNTAQMDLNGISIWANYNNSLTWIKAIWGWFPLLTMIPVRSQWGRYNLPRSMDMLALPVCWLFAGRWQRLEVSQHIEEYWIGFFGTPFEDSHPLKSFNLLMNSVKPQEDSIHSKVKHHCTEPMVLFSYHVFMALPTLAGGWNSWLRDCMTISQHANHTGLHAHHGIMSVCLSICVLICMCEHQFR